MHHLTKLAAIVAAGTAAAALSACTATEEARPKAPQPAGTTAVPAPSATPEPTATATATKDNPTTRVTKTKVSTTKTTWTAVDWSSVTFDALNCPRLSGIKGADVDGVQFADLTGDGRKDAVVAASCKTTTARNPISIFVYDGTDTQVPLKRLLSIGVRQYLVTADVTVKGRTVSVTSKALSDKAPRCCPDLVISQSYTWRDGRFAGTAYDEKAL